MRACAALLIIILLTGCSRKDKVPSGILTREQMGSVLWDMIQADQYANIYLIKDSSKINLKTEDLKLYQQVFELHSISRDDFRKSLKYYEDNPDILRSVFDTLINRGNKIRTDNYSRSVPTTPAGKPAPGNSFRVPGASPIQIPVKTPGQPSVKFPNKPPGKPGKKTDSTAKAHPRPEL